jgi:hypothetical protein
MYNHSLVETDIVLTGEFPAQTGSPTTSDDDESVSSSRPSSPISPSTPTSPLRKSFYVNYDYELFHIVLFYLYTQRICFTASPEMAKSSEIPTTNDAEGIYAIAHRLLLEDLSKKAFHYLQATCNVGNITKRSFGRFAADHQDVERYYDDWLLNRWEEVRNSEEFEQYFKEMEANYEEHIRITRKFRRLFKSQTISRA